MARLTERQTNWILGAVGLGSYALLLTLEIVTESDELEPLDLIFDALALLLTIASSVGVALLVGRMHRQHEEKLALIRDLELARTEGRDWRTKVERNLEGLRVEMNRQFDDWGMTPAERDVALLILKGLSHKEIAALRGTSEGTVRQQAQSVYTKSDLPGKTALSAYFLDDLLHPTEAAAPAYSGSRLI